MLFLLMVTQVGGQVFAAETVDFGIESVALPATLYSNTPGVAVVKVRNNGGPIDGARIHVNFFNSRTDSPGTQAPTFSSASFSKPAATPRIEAGEVVTLVSWANPNYLPAGSYQLKAVLGFGETAYNKDSNAANNVSTLSYQVLGGREPGTNGDLAITGYKLNDKTTYHELVVDMANLGTDPLVCNFNVELTAQLTAGVRQAFSGKQVVYPPTSPFAPGATKQLVFQIVDADTRQRLATGTYPLALNARSTANPCPEINYVNNTKQENVAISPPPINLPSSPTRLRY